ncbi:MAG: S8 family serine peptidase [Muribaculaceae bacterium]|nr:S8 family serine peptidase [Muribaculaceae bacterium]
MKTIHTIILAFLFIMCPVGVIAQTNFYYYKGNKIPLAIDNDKICVNIPNNGKGINNIVLKDISALSKIKDSEFDIFIIKQSDLPRLSVSNLEIDGHKTISFSPCFKTMAGAEVYSTPYLNVRLKKEQDIDLLASYADKYGFKIIKNDSLLPLWYILAVSPETDATALEVANALWESGEFAAAVPDLASDNNLCSNDPMFDQQWGLHNSDYADADISILPAWEYATGKGVKIAILDNGVDLSHQDLASNISDLSYDTETNTSPSVLRSYNSHGTHCAGIAAAVKDNGVQIAGVAPNAEIVSISNSMDTTTNSQLKRANGMVWAYLHGVDIISNSWRSGNKHEAIDEAIHDAFSYGRQGKGCVIVFASGNFSDDSLNNRNDSCNYVIYPACCNDTILAVGSIRRYGSRAATSRYGPELDLVAPGDSILSTLINNRTDYKSGTSMACPHVAGVAALILERNSELTVNQVNSIICGNAKKISGVDFSVTKPDGMWNEEYGYGLVDAYSCVVNTPDTIYIQNETITGSRIISADNIYVGKDVSDEKPHGNVTLGQGQITLTAKTVTIKNSTTVPLGTILTIENR